MATPIVIHGKDRSPQDECEALMAFAKANEDLSFMRRAMLDASTVAMKEGRYSSDNFERGWRLWYDDAAKQFKRQFGWTPLAEARKLAANVEAHAFRYSHRSR